MAADSGLVHAVVVIQTWWRGIKGKRDFKVARVKAGASSEARRVVWCGVDSSQVVSRRVAWCGQ